MLGGLQDRLLRLLGATVDQRTTLVERMLHRDASESTAYWLQLVVAIGIATLGLVVGSTAVIIGAMLVAPLMTPILGLAIGLSTGGPFLVFRSVGRIVASVVAAVLGAAAVTWLLPFHELNAELLARTSPTVLDLVTAAFCALAGVYASLRPGSETVAAAAGTSIGISLVPPLCACGFGVGAGDWRIASGAALLFVTNFVAIVVVGGLAFAVLGFGRVAVIELESHELSRDPEAQIAAAIGRRLAKAFATRAGRALRLVMPLGFLAAVYVPLVKALDEIGWQVRVKSAVASELASSSSPIVQSRSRVEHHQVEVSVVIVGTPGAARTLKQSLETGLRLAADVTPRVEVFAVADATAVAGLESSLATPPVISLPPPPPVPEPPLSEPPLSEGVDTSREALRQHVESIWPSTSAGPLLSVELDTLGQGAFSLRVRHLGAPLAADTLETQRKVLESALEHPCSITDVAIPSAPLTRDSGDLVFVGEVAAALEHVADLESIHVCVVRPTAPARGRPSKSDEELAVAIDRLLGRAPRVVTVRGEAWRVTLGLQECPVDAAPKPAK